MIEFDRGDPLARITGENGRRESKRSYAAFLAYCEMGPARSLRALLAKYEQDPKPLTRSLNTIGHWSRNFAWVERARLFEQQQQAKALEEYQAQWRAKIMSGDEVLGRLSEQARSSIADFVSKRVEALLDKDGKPTGETIESIGLNWEAIRENGHLIKSITSTANGPRIELHDGQAAIIQVGRYHKLFVDRQDVSGTIKHENDPRENERFDQAVSTLADALRKILPGASPEPDNDLAAPK